MKEMIADLPHDVRSRVESLLADPTLGYRRFTPANPRSDTTLSNCFGTAIFCLNLEDTILAALQANHVLSRAGKRMRAEWTPAKSADRPGYIDGRLLEMALEDTSRLLVTATILPGDLIVLHDSRPEHAGIALGTYDQKGYIFHQQEYGGLFGISTIDEHAKYCGWLTPYLCTAYRVLERKVEIPLALER